MNEGTDLSALAFNMDFGLFRTTPVEALLYPNPAAEALQGPDHVELFAFLGRILGKALDEGLTVEPKFAHFFLSYLKVFIHTNSQADNQSGRLSISWKRTLPLFSW